MGAGLGRAAIWYARHGWRVFPCVPGKKLPAIKAWPRQATANEAQVASWWSVRPDSNIGVACGPGSGLYVLDVDQHGVDGEEALAQAERRLGKLPFTVEQRTGSGGRQLFFAWPQGSDLRNKVGTSKPRRGQMAFGSGLDTRGNGGFVVAPPSMHPCGVPYRWLAGPHERELKALPQAWVEAMEKTPEPVRIEVPIARLDLMDRLGREAVERICGYLTSRPAGERNASLFWAARKLAGKSRQGQVVWLEAERALWQAARGCGLDDIEIGRTIGSAQRHGRGAA